MRIGYSDSFDSILSNLGKNQTRLGNLATQLSTGLRINSAADDPSGLAIAESLKKVSNGLQQGIANVQTANNALTVADGALSTITGILQRMRSLVIEANSDLNSTDNLAQIQTEIDQLTLEINRISSNTNFNGLHLLDGGLNSTIQQAPYLNFKQNPQVNNNTQTLIDVPNTLAAVSPPGQQVEFSFSVDSYDATNNLLQVTFKVESPDPSFGPTQVNTLHVTPGTNFFAEYGPIGPPYYVVQNQAGGVVFQFNFNTLQANDVGKEADVVSFPQQNAQTGNPLTVNTGTSEGSNLSIAIGATNTTTLAVNQIVVGDALANFAAETRIDYALDTLNFQRAQIGAQVVSLNEAANDASIQYVNQVASESSIRDLNIGTATTEFTKQQILVQVGTSVLSQSEASTGQIAALLINALVA